MRILVFVGVILIGVGVYVAQSNIGVKINGRRADAETANTARYAIGGGLGGLGALLAIGGVVGMVRGSRETKRKQLIMQTGVDGEGTVTFVDKNYALLVNKTPIYSIVEYTYRDGAGKEHTRRITNASSEVVIRKQIQVGGKVPIKYLPQDPSQSVLVLA